MEVGNRIKELRKQKNMSQNSLAKKIKNLNQSQICKIENGDRSIKADELKEIAHALNIPVSELLN
ncbi:helix-turn-helix domain-containing protein [Clostridium beijerinckii]|uniref:helix-turn-helix domain-containing protein n=1 Tax=Clostridium beijerinckii TaxID=1520 RepID=UPI00098CD34C|nr:helix-turn-helix transcriptional regulator [Clostridium beijerinckii]MBA8937302.1 transcriptional regulator with XRE-family HTH domain [Clostridium beijerinckii]NRU40232.1 transcriptional regulator with XRE-family HTH domain [Clostridium beijerinckii]NSA96491.1 transcriptional regulator with XRE-family HTH domain [Clostridium beijerinckii]OOM63029.1 anaerobic benzoate catabolism transcriptional regulator [Clostridium beijerinckii]OOM64569.1 anaerobic benzoate catabolism transcriptional regu